MKLKLIFYILFLGTLLRVSGLDYPLLSDEPNRDYLISRHVTKYGEFINFGPNNGTFSNLGNSPVYNYILSLLLLLNDSLMFLTIVNLVLQIITIYLVYLIIKNLISEKTALTTSLFMSLGEIFILQSTQMWQPNLMIFFLTLSGYILFLSFKKQSYKYLLIAAILLSLSISIHMSAIAIIPAFAWAAFLTSKVLKLSKIHIFGILLAFLVPLMLFYIPIFEGFDKTSFNNLTLFQNWASNIMQRFITLFEVVNLPVFIGLAIILVGVLKRYYFVTFSIISFLIISSLVDTILLPQHFYPVLIMLVILISQTISNFKSKAVITLTILLFIYFNNAINIKNFSFMNLDKLEAKNLIINDLSENILETKSSRNYIDLNFFQFRIYDSERVTFFTNNPQTVDAFLWANLEKKLDTRFTTITQKNREVGYKTTNTDDVIFLFCRFYTDLNDEKQNCHSKFKEEYPNHNLQEEKILNTYNQSVYKAVKI